MSAIGQQQKLNQGSGQNFTSPFPVFIPKQQFIEQISTSSLPAHNVHQFSQPPPTFRASNPQQMYPPNLHHLTQSSNNIMQFYPNQSAISYVNTPQSATSMHILPESQNMINLNDNHVNPEFNFGPGYVYRQNNFQIQPANQMPQNLNRPVYLQSLNGQPGNKVIMMVRPPMNMQQYAFHHAPPINQIQVDQMNQYQHQQQQKSYDMRSDTSTPQYALPKQTLTQQMPSPRSDIQSETSYPATSYPNDIVYYTQDLRTGGHMGTGIAKKPRKGLPIIDPDTKQAVDILATGSKEFNNSAPNVVQEFYDQVHNGNELGTMNKHNMESLSNKPINEFIPKCKKNELIKKLDINVTEFVPKQNLVEKIEDFKDGLFLQKRNDDMSISTENNKEEIVLDSINGQARIFLDDKNVEIFKDEIMEHVDDEIKLIESRVDFDTYASGEAVFINSNENEYKKIENIKFQNLLKEVTPQSSNPSSNDELLEKEAPMHVHKSKKSKKNKKKKNQIHEAKTSRRNSLVVSDSGSKTPVDQQPSIDQQPLVIADIEANISMSEVLTLNNNNMDKKIDNFDDVFIAEKVSCKDSFEECSKIIPDAALSINVTDIHSDSLNLEEKIVEDYKTNGCLKNSVTLPSIVGLEDEVATKTTSRKSSLQELNKINFKEPLTQTGMRLYSREMLLQIRDTIAAQNNNSLLVNIPSDVLRTEDTASLYNTLTRQTSNNNYADVFTPKYVTQPNNWAPVKRPSQKRDPMSHMMGGSAIGNQCGQRVINVSLQNDVQLHTVENAWRSSTKSADVSELNAEEKLYKKTRSILNKLTPQNFDTLVDQIKHLPIDTEDKLKRCIAIVFEKAISEPSYCIAYARMAQSIKSLEVKSKDDVNETVSFRKLLLNSCQAEFEKDNQTELDIMQRKKEIDESLPEDKRKTLILEMDEISSKSRRRSLGNIRFIGELFRIKMLTDTIMINCLFKLLQIRDEDSLECLCGLIRTIGKDLDTPKNAGFISNFYKSVLEVSRNTSLPLRIRFMIQDVIELKDNNWVPRRVDNNPKTIEQIHQEARQEDFQKQILLNTPLPQKMQQSQRPGGGRLSLEKSYHDDAWTMSSGNNLRGFHEKTPIDVSRMRITKQPTVDEVKLGPARTNWGTGATGGRSSQEADKINHSSNRFQMLSEDNRNKDMYSSKTWNRPPHFQGNRVFGTSSRNESPSSNSSRGVSRESSLTRCERLSRATPPIASETVNKVQQMTQLSSSTEKHISLEELERRTKNTFEEYYSIRDYMEVFMTLEEMKLNAKFESEFINCAICNVMEETQQKLLLTGDLLYKIVEFNRINKISFTNGLSSALKTALELEIDIPRIWQCLGDLLSSFIKLNEIHLQIVAEACQHLVPYRKTGLIFSAAFDRMIKINGKPKAIKLWESSGLKWTDLTDEPILIYANKYHLESMNPFMFDLKLRILNDSQNCEKVAKWIEEQNKNVNKSSTFIRSITTAICSSALCEKNGNYEVSRETLLLWQPLFKQFISNTAEDELQVIYALQHLVTSLDSPSYLLYNLFNAMYQEELISEDAFFEWEKSNDPLEQAGKGTAIASTKQFFSLIRGSVIEKET